jgi:phosphoribosylglycinamide formyltransferase-1
MNFAFYCSGGASRYIKFYEKHEEKQFSPSFIFYDGESLDTISKIQRVTPNVKMIAFSPIDALASKKEISIQLSNELLALLQKHEIDYLFCFGSSILRGELIAAYKKKIINFHPSILPAFPGLNAIDQALKTSVKVLGNTAHYIDEGIDTGEIIMQSVLLRKEYSCYEDVLGLQIEMLRRIWIGLEQNNFANDTAGVNVLYA